MGMFDDTISPYTSGSGYDGAVAPDMGFTGADTSGMIDTGGMYTPSSNGMIDTTGMYTPSSDAGSLDLSGGNDALGGYDGSSDSWTTNFLSGLDIASAWTGDTSNEMSAMFKDSLTSSTFNDQVSTPLGDVKRSDLGSASDIEKMLQENPLSKAYNGLDDQGKKFIWSAALSMFGQLMTSGARDQQRKAANKTADAIAKNAETNRLTYQLAADKQNNAMTSAGAAWPGVKKMSSQYAPPTMINVGTRWSPP